MSKRGSSLIEVLVVLGLTVVLLGTAYSSWYFLNRSTRTQSAKIDARRQMEAGLSQIRSNVQAARYVFTRPTLGGTVLFGGHNYNLPPINGLGPMAADLLVAEPETADTNSTSYKIFGFYLQPMSDPNNPNATQIVEQWTGNQTLPLVSNSLLGIDLSAIGPVSKLVLDAYIDNSTLNVSVSGSTDPYMSRCVSMQLGFKLRPTDLARNTNEYMLSEDFEMTVFPRNQ
jgi:type II secretory pathway pseudopilin PulG